MLSFQRGGTLYLEKGDSSAQVLIGLKFSADVSFLSDAMKVDDEIGMSWDLQAASWTILCDEESLTGVNASTNKSAGG